MEALLPDLWAGLKTGGLPVLLLAYLWLSERQERRQLQQERDQLLERVIKGLSDGTASVQAAIDSIASTKAAIYALKELFLSSFGRRPDA